MSIENSPPLLSIIVPVFNVQAYLEQCLNSIISQSYTNIELIVVNDGSTDSSAEICDNYAKRDARIVVIHKNNGGLSDARNAGLKLAKGNWIGFVDSDDWIEPMMYYDLMKAVYIDNSDIGCTGFYYEHLNGNSEPNPPDSLSIDRYITDFTIRNQWIPALLSGKLSDLPYMLHSVCDKIFRRDLISEFYSERLYLNEETIFVLNALLKAKSISAYFKYGYHYRLRAGSLIHTKHHDILQKRHSLNLLLSKILEKEPNSKYTTNIANRYFLGICSGVSQLSAVNLSHSYSELCKITTRSEYYHFINQARIDDSIAARFTLFLLKNGYWRVAWFFISIYAKIFKST